MHSNPSLSDGYCYRGPGPACTNCMRVASVKRLLTFQSSCFFILREIGFCVGCNTVQATNFGRKLSAALKELVQDNLLTPAPADAKAIAALFPILDGTRV